MAISLLQTKFFIPSARGELVPRPRLSKRLDEALAQGCRLVLVAAPAGFGKTTLLAGWIAGRKCAWLALDPADDDPIRFWTYLIAALQTTNPNLGETALFMLQTPQPPPVEMILTDLINEIAALPMPLILVLDDYHLIETPAIHQNVAFLLDHLPPRLHLIILTRADPPLPLARLRVRGQLAELRAADLRFTTAEAADFLNRTMGLDLSAGDIAALEAHTEGWIAALQLAALSMQHGENTRDFVSAFTGSNHYIVDYLTEEVLGCQRQEVQSFLLRTAVLEQLTGSLCDALTGQSDGQVMLESLEKANLFLVRLDNERHWYRYHHLLAHSLQSRLQQNGKELVFDLHRRAADWFEQHGFFDQAMTHWVQAQDWERAAQLIERDGSALLSLGEIASLRHWLDALPQAHIRERLWLCILSAWVRLLSLDMEKATLWIESAQACLSLHLADISYKEMAGQIAALRAYIAGLNRDDQQAQMFCHQALERLPSDRIFLRGLIAYMLGMINLRGGDLDGAWTAIEQAGRASQASGTLHIAVLAQAALGIIQSLRGKLHLAYESYQQALRLAAQGRQRPLPVAAAVYGHLAGLMYEWNDLEAADRYLAQGTEQSRQWGSIENLINNALAHAQLCRARGDLDGVQRMLDQAQEIVPNTQLRIGQIVTAQIRHQIDLGELAAAEQLARQSGIGDEGELTVNTINEWMMLARLRLAQGQLDQAAHLLARLQTFCSSRLISPMIEVLRLQALSLQAQQQTDQALVSLRQSLLLAEPGGYIRSFVDEGPAMYELLAALQRRLESNCDAATESLLAYVNKVLAAFPTTQPGARQPQSPPLSQPLIEPLSERELEVLRLLAEGRSNQEIGDELFIAVGTVKKHLSNIFGKLGVQNRTECAARARELGLI